MLVVAEVGSCTDEGGVSSLFLRRPANCEESEGGSGGGVPDMGGVGKDAQEGNPTGTGTGRLSLRGNDKSSSLYLCFEKEWWVVGSPDNCGDGMRVVIDAIVEFGIVQGINRAFDDVLVVLLKPCEGRGIAQCTRCNAD